MAGHRSPARALGGGQHRGGHRGGQGRRVLSPEGGVLTVGELETIHPVCTRWTAHIALTLNLSEFYLNAGQAVLGLGEVPKWM